jgi:hypothetical protein
MPRTVASILLLISAGSFVAFYLLIYAPPDSIELKGSDSSSAAGYISLATAIVSLATAVVGLITSTRKYRSPET